MWRRMEMLHYTLVLLLLLGLVICGPSCGDSKAQGSASYRLSRGGYSRSTNTLLFAVSIDLGKPLKGSFLGTYKEDDGLATSLLYPIDIGPYDFAWAPGHAVFVLTHADRMTLFREDAASDRGYSGAAIRCPVSVLYTYCSWNPKGEWLAVNCHDLRENSGHRLGLYELKEGKFVISDIVIDHRSPVWKDDTTIYIPNGDSINEVRLESGAARLARTIPIEEKTTLFYGVIDDQALTQKDKKVKLGDRTLIELDRASRFAVIVTRTAIFVSASPTNLAVFDHEGREMSKTNPRRTIRFGSIGRNPNSVYGLADSVLLHICVKKGSLNIQEVCDLANSE
ncbi:MAG: hypothetical protein ACYTAO_00940 [Planctomycetota bacterium]